MDYLYQKLPKDLVNIVEEYAKDRTNYDKVINEFNIKISWIIDIFISKMVFVASYGQLKEVYLNSLIRCSDFYMFHMTYDYRNRILTQTIKKREEERKRERYEKIQIAKQKYKQKLATMRELRKKK